MNRIFGEHDEKTVTQLQNCVAVEEGALGVLCADGHLGYSQPIGGVVAYREHVSPSGVGYDIGCGNKAVLTNLKYDDIAGDLPRIMDEIVGTISFGVGRRDGVSGDHHVIDEIRTAEFAPQRALLDTAAKQLGTVGAGNHYVDLFRDEVDRVWIGVHFGSRGFGHKTASGFLAMAQGLAFDEHASEGEMMSPPVVFKIGGELASSYQAAMALAGRYAYAGRDVVCAQVLGILGARSDFEVHNHHNYGWWENHYGEDFWVVRKGATPAFPNQLGFVGATMGEPSVILKGIDSLESREALFSTVHGAGRAMSRSAAAGKQKKRWTCNNRDCEWVQPPFTHKPERCPDCGNGSFSKRWVQVAEGRVSWTDALADLELKRVELRGGAADEAPLAYKRLDEVLAAHDRTIKRVHTLWPIGVAMAGADTFDPFKD